ncbi:MAG TPA: ABC transporter permease subunit, partial [Spirochaetia bacterium]|nr:ABC transporter permease subunit [Spirochaetia bacterium]
VLPYLLVLPQLLVVAVFFLWPALRVIGEAAYTVNAFGMNPRFAGLHNFVSAMASGRYANSVAVTAIYSAMTTLLSMALGLLIAVLVDGVRKGRAVYRTLFAWTYAVPTAVVGTLWLFMFQPEIGAAARLLNHVGIPWNFNIRGFDSMSLIIMLTVWQQAAYNFLFFTAGLQGISAHVLEAATLDGAGAIRRFWRITFPLLSPTTFYLLVLNIVYVFFSTFAIINIVTQGGPYDATDTMVYQIYLDAFQDSNTSIAAAETVLLIVLVSALTVLQFRYVNRRVHYQ